MTHIVRCDVLCFCFETRCYLWMRCVVFQMEGIIERMQDECTGVPVRTVKSFMSKVPSVFTGQTPIVISPSFCLCSWSTPGPPSPSPRTPSSFLPKAQHQTILCTCVSKQYCHLFFVAFALSATSSCCEPLWTDSLDSPDAVECMAPINSARLCAEGPTRDSLTLSPSTVLFGPTEEAQEYRLLLGLCFCLMRVACTRLQQMMSVLTCLWAAEEGIGRDGWGGWGGWGGGEIIMQGNSELCLCRISRWPLVSITKGSGF